MASLTEPLKVGVIGGSGLGQLLGEAAGGPAAKRHVVDTPFGPPSDAVVEVEWAGVPVLLLNRHGPGHLLNPSRVPYRANLFALKSLGCTHVIATGAVGSLREEFKPRDLVVADGVIDKTAARAGTFYDAAAVHVGFDEPFCPVLRQLLLDSGPAGPAGPAASAEKPYAVHDRGCYLAMEGPAFSSRSESLMHRLWGGDLVGMTAMPEAKLAREAELSYALVALVTDYDSWRPKPEPAVDAEGKAVPVPAAGPVGPAGRDHRQPDRGVGERPGPDPPGRRPNGRAAGATDGRPESAGAAAGDLVGQGGRPAGRGKPAGPAVGVVLHIAGTEVRAGSQATDGAIALGDTGRRVVVERFQVSHHGLIVARAFNPCGP